MPHFSEAQLQELATIFGLKKVEETLPVRDGVVTRESMVWWRAKDGPVCVQARQDWYNIKAFPDLYQLMRPKIRCEYLEEDL